MTKLSVRLLGPPEVRLKGDLVEIPGQSARIILYYLAFQGGIAGQKDLQSLLDLAGQQPRDALEKTLSGLRLSLPGLYRIQGSQVRLNLKEVWVDQWEFLDLVDQAGHAPWQTSTQEPLPEPALQLIQQAGGLWRSPHFMEGEDFSAYPRSADWLAVAREKMEREYSRIAERLAEHHFVTGNTDLALLYARLGLVVEPLNENLNGLALRSLILFGNYTAAEEHFQKLEADLRNALDTSPSPSLIALYRSFHSPPASREASPPAPGWKLHSSLQVPFIGRKSFLEALNQAYQQGGGVLIIGESGQGKTRLLMEFTSQLSPSSRLLLAECRPAENSLPFQPIIDLLRHQVLPVEWLTLPEIWTRQLTILLPEIAVLLPKEISLGPENEPELAEGDRRTVLFEAIRQVFLHLTRQGPLLVCLDDAQWSDEATLATLAYLLERPPFDSQACLIIAARPGEKNSHLESILPFLQQSSHFRFLSLNRLVSAEILELVSSLTGSPPGEEIVQQLDQATGGNPLFILETLRSFTGGEISTTAGLPPAKSLAGLIHARLDSLTPNARRMLEAAAILGSDFDPEILVELSHQSPEKVVDALVELERRLLVEPSLSRPDLIRYRFVHEKIREVLVEETNPLQQRLLHRRAADIIEKRLAGQPSSQVAVLARHLELSGQLAPAFDLWLQAGRYDRQLFAIADACQAFSRAAALSPLIPGLKDEQLRGLYADWTSLVYQLEDAGTIERINEELLQLGQARGSPMLIGAAYDGLSDVCMVTNQYERGLFYAEKAIFYLEQTDNLDQHMDAYIHRGVFLYLLNRVEDAVESLQDALALGAGAEDPLVVRAQADAHYQIAICRMLQGWPSLGLQNAHRSLEAALLSKWIHVQVNALSAISILQYWLGDYNEARDACHFGMSLASRIDAWRMQGYLHLYQGFIDVDTGHIDQGLEHAHQAIRLGEKYQHKEIQAAGLRVHGDVYFWLEHYDQAVLYYRRALEASGGGFLAIDPMFRLGLGLAKTGQVESGLAYLDEASAIAQATGQGIILLLANLARVQIDQIKGDWTRAKNLALQTVSEAKTRFFPAVQLHNEIILGEIARCEEQNDRAAAYFQGAAARAAKLSQPWLELKALSGLQELARLSGQTNPEIKVRMSNILDRIEAGVAGEPASLAFCKFRSRILS